jgi:hypothetical protein
VGEATLTWGDGARYIGTFRNGVPDGKGYFRDADGMQYEGDVSNGRRDGAAEGVFPNGDHYQGQWKNGKPDGIGHMKYMLGGAYEGEWKHGKRHGKGTLIYAGSGHRHEGRFVDGMLENSAPHPTPTATYNLKADRARAGTMFRYDIARGGTVPLDIGYDAFTPEQKRLFNSYYPALEEGDEPPYPRLGNREFYKLMSRMGGTFDLNEDVRIYVLVGADGKAVSVTVMGLNDPELRKLAGSAAGLLEYKPALCSGKPCPMMFGFNLRLKAEW